MSQTAIASDPDAQLLQSLALPEFKGTPAGPLHTVLLDDDGSIYYSDELNHVIVSLDLHGSVRWARGIHEKEKGEFRYPRGISLGSIHIRGEVLRCLAIADAWNRRVRFLSVDGRPLTDWGAAGHDLFKEPSDVRFIPHTKSTTGGRSEGYWLVLDTNAHRICAFGEDGKLLFQLGRCFPPRAALGWAIPAIGLENDPPPPGIMVDFPPFDFLYYPTRILGRSEEALYTWEPNPQLVKRILYGNLLPLFFPASGPVEWIAADDRGFLGWSRSSSCLLRYDSAGEEYQKIRINGTPASSNLPSSQFWIQTHNEIQRWVWEMGKLPAAGNRESDALANSVLLCTAENAIKRPDEDDIRPVIAEVVDTFQESIRLADEFLSKARHTRSANGGWNPLQEMIRKLDERRSTLDVKLCSPLHFWSMGVLELRILRSGSVSDKAEQAIRSIKNRWDALADPLRKQFGEIQRRVDDLFMLGLDLEIRPLADSSAQAFLQLGMSLMEQHLLNIRNWLERWSGVVDGSTDVVSLSRNRDAVDTNFPDPCSGDTGS